MARAITAAELVKLRRDGFSALYHVIIDEPDTVYTARATGAVSTTDWSLGFDGGSGTLGDCLADMTMLIGSSAGASDKGIARLRKAPIAGTFYLGADPSLVVADDDYLTVLNDFAIWARHPVGTSIDVDTAYSDQFANYAPYPVMGDCAVIDAGDTVGFDASDAWVPGSTISAYSWTFTGATSYTGETTATPTATYATSGRFRVSMLITATNGKNYTGYRWVYVLGTNLAPETGAVVGEPEGDKDGGWSVPVLMYDRPTIANNRRVVLYSDDRYGVEAVSIGPFSGRENIVLIGWIIGETIERQPGQDTVEFEVAGPIGVMARTQSLLAGLQNSTYPVDEGQDPLPAWCTPASMTTQKALHYLAFYRSTLARVVDLRIDDKFLWPVAWVTGDDANLYEQFVSFCAPEALTFRADRYGRLYAERDAQLYPEADRAADIPVVMTLTGADWQDKITIIRRQTGGVAMATAEGLLSSGTSTTQVGGRSPGDWPAEFGELEQIQDLFPDVQASALELAGLLAGWKNAELETISVELTQNNRMIDVAPRQYVCVSWNGTTYYCVPRGVRLRAGPGKSVIVALELEPRGGEWPSTAILYPAEGEEPIDNSGSEDTQEPPAPPTEEQPGEPIEEPETPGGADAVVAVIGDIRTTPDLDQASPTWTSEL